MLALAVKLVLAHLTGDFLLQPTKWVTGKRNKQKRLKYLLWHILVHLAALTVVLQFSIDYWLGVLIIIITHFSIDIIKLNLEKKFNSQVLFFADQALHLFVLGMVVSLYEPFEVNVSALYETSSLLLITFLIIITYVSSIVIKTIMVGWKEEGNSPNQAGKYIGMLERLFIFFFILNSYWAGIGFLLAAKSVFRFNDISKDKERTLAEYILIGTLLSFGLAIVAALGYLYLMKRMNG